MGPRRAKTKRISVPLTLDEVEILERIATERERSVSWVAANAIRFFLAERAKKEAPATRLETTTPAE